MIDRVEAIRGLIKNGRSYADIGAQFGISREWVRQIAEKYNLGGGRKASHKRRDAFLARVRETKDVLKAAAEFGYGAYTARAYARSAGLGEAQISRARRNEMLAPLVERVRNGESIRQAAGCDHLLAISLGTRCRELGVKSSFLSRWRDISPHRGPIIREGAPLGLSWKEIASKVSEAEKRHTGAEAIRLWAARHIPDLDKPRAKHSPTTEQRIKHAPRPILPVTAREGSSELVQHVCSLKGQKSASEIASELGLASKNVVIGIWYRHGIAQASNEAAA